MNKMNIGLACDHAGFEHKEKLKEYLITKGMKVEDLVVFLSNR